MLNLRYHVASLAAVFVALAVGIVIGVAIASGGKVADTTQGLREDELKALQKSLEAARERSGLAEADRAAMEDLLEEVYPGVMANRLAGKNVVLLFLGPIDGDLARAVEGMLADAGAETPTSVTALELPIDTEAIDAILVANPLLARYAGDAELGALGEALGRELVQGADPLLWDALRSEIVLEETGSLSLPASGVVVVETWAPETTDDAAQAERDRQAAALVAGLVQGMDRLGVPVVGVEASTSETSAVGLYRDLGVSSVDDVDTLAGRVALGLLLAGGPPGHYGTKDSATSGVAPPLEPLVVATVAE